MSRVARSLIAGLLCASLIANWATVRFTVMHAASVSAPSAPATGLFDEYFTTKTLNTNRWHWINGPAANSNLIEHHGYLRIYTENGRDLALRQNNPKTNASLLVEKAPATGDYEVTTHLEITPTQNFQQAGIVLYRDDNNYCELKYAFNKGSGGTLIVTRLLTPGQVFDFKPKHVTLRPSGYYLQLDIKVGKKGVTTYTGWESTNGTAPWTFVHAYTGTFTPAFIGMFAVNGGAPATSIPADFDFIQERPLGVGTSGPLSVAAPPA